MNIRLDVVSRLLSGVINQDGDRSLDACIYDVLYCIDLTDLLIEKCSEPARAAREIPPAASSSTWTSDEAIERIAIKNAKAAFAERVERRQLARGSRPPGEVPPPDPALIEFRLPYGRHRHVWLPPSIGN